MEIQTAIALWHTLIVGSKVAALMMSKAKLGPLLHKGETVRNELSGATIASRLKEFIFEHSGVRFGDLHFLTLKLSRRVMVSTPLLGYVWGKYR